ncbi:MAG: DUF4393 domain-containing protein [bacterium]|nr:DUF4393 domain-containing protein [bacterium]
MEKPPLSIAGPLVFQLLFAKDEPELKELYASLLSSAMDPSESAAHPSFVSIIQQLTPDEANILRYIAQIDEDLPSLSENSISEGCAKEAVSFKFEKWCEKAGVAHLDRSDAYMDNLIRLRILHQVIGNDTKYKPEYVDRYGIFDASVSNTEYEIIELIPFGRLFLNACIEKETTNTNSTDTKNYAAD